MKITELPTFQKLDYDVLHRTLLVEIEQLNQSTSPVDSYIGTVLETFLNRVKFNTGTMVGKQEVVLIQTMLAIDPTTKHKLPFSAIENAEKYFRYGVGKTKKKNIKYQLKDFYGIFHRATELHRTGRPEAAVSMFLMTVISMYNKDHLTLTATVREFIEHLYYQGHVQPNLTIKECVLYDRVKAFRYICKTMEQKGFLLNRELPIGSTENYVELISTMAFCYLLFLLGLHRYTTPGVEKVFRSLLCDIRTYLRDNEDLVSHQALP